MKRLLHVSTLVATLFFAPRVFAEPAEAPALGTQLSELVAGWLDWILDTASPEPPPPPPPPPPSGPSGDGGGSGGGPGYGGVVLPGG